MLLQTRKVSLDCLVRHYRNSSISVKSRRQILVISIHLHAFICQDSRTVRLVRLPNRETGTTRLLVTSEPHLTDCPFVIRSLLNHPGPWSNGMTAESHSA